MDSLKVIPTSFWNDQFWDTLLTAVLQPTRLGFNMGEVEVLDKLPEQTLGTLQMLMRALPQSITKDLQKKVSDHLQNRFYL